jgi:hypothetical protein
MALPRPIVLLAKQDTIYNPALALRVALALTSSTLQKQHVFQQLNVVKATTPTHPPNSVPHATLVVFPA